jgi:hypothetical protein
MQGKHTVFSSLLKPISHTKFNEFVEKHQGNKGVKKFTTWSLFLVLLQGQLSGRNSLRTVKLSNDCASKRYYGTEVPKIALSSLSHACKTRDPQIFMDVFSHLVNRLNENCFINKELAEFIHLIDATPIPLKGNGYEWVKDNYRIKGLKVHTVYDLHLEAPVHFTISAANVNDITEGKRVALKSGGIYIYDKGYYDYEWWNGIAEKGSYFVTRLKKDTPYKIIKTYVPKGENILNDEIIILTSEKARKKFTHPLRMIEIILDDGKIITIVTNKLSLSAKWIAQLYRWRWQIELFFKCIKQHLKIKRFWGKNENAVKLQIITALIAFLLLKLIQVKTNTSFSIKYIGQIVCLKLSITSNIYTEIKKMGGKASKRRLAL